ncbi:chain-length determining protein [Metapseudomonas furukawaii]|uniref:Wzz/FepE/Etk N-terminal domain-containing protein n=1 Tax=Metapseudomonas furukawaii TaxID=1149133 RepID=UPI00227B482F|nr:Wzz/FepE/Etk N-terminal domain-containing protein [Pseudomonas furukawaii]WAG81798.1 chain-length determining protein [Pseudomonas furukawaii]
MNGPVVRPQQFSDEIDLVALFKDLWKQKLLVLSITGLATALAAVYAFTATPYYKVESVLRTASLKDLDELNGSGLYSLTPKQALRNVGDALESYSLRMKYFHENPELFKSLQNDGEPLERALERLNRYGLAMLRPDPKKGADAAPFQGISLTYPEGLDGVAVVNGLILAAIDQERQRVQDDFDVFVSNRLTQLQSQIATERARYEADKESRIASLSEADQLKKSRLQDELRALRQQLQVRRQNRIKQLDEAIQIAENLGIAKPTTPSALGDSAREVQGSVIRTEVNNQQIPLYFMGSETLKAERSALQSRRSDDFTEPRIAEIQKELNLLANNRQIEILKRRDNEDLFFKNLVKLRGEQARLENLKVDFSRLQLVRVDQPATAPQKPEKPRKALILALGLVGGLMLGGFVALIRVMVLRQRVGATAA